MTEHPQFTTERRQAAREQMGWGGSGEPWSDAIAESTEIVVGESVDVLPDGAPSGIVTSFENESVGEVPSGWVQVDHGSNGGAQVDDTWASDGDKSIRNTNFNTGSPSHSHIETGDYAPTGDHVLTFDYYLDGNKNNSGVADVFSFSNLSQHTGDRGDAKASYQINIVNNGSGITAFDGDGSGDGNVVGLEPAKFDQPVTLSIIVEYSNNRYFVEIDGSRYGPFGFRYDGSAADFPVFHSMTDNWTGWFDNLR